MIHWLGMFHTFTPDESNCETVNVWMIRSLLDVEQIRHHAHPQLPEQRNYAHRFDASTYPIMVDQIKSPEDKIDFRVQMFQD